VPSNRNGEKDGTLKIALAGSPGILLHSVSKQKEEDIPDETIVEWILDAQYIVETTFIVGLCRAGDFLS